MTFIFPRSYLSGLTISTSINTFGVAAGQTTDSANQVIINLAAAISKTTAAWQAGTGNGALDIGTIAPGSWYHDHIISDDIGGSADILTSLSATAPNLPNGYTRFRRIGSRKTDSFSNWIPTIQIGDTVLWMTPIGDIVAAAVSNSSPGTTFTLGGVPTGVNVTALFNAEISNVSASSAVTIHSPLTGVQACDVPSGNVNLWDITANNAWFSGGFNIMTDEAAHIVAIANTTGITLTVATIGYIDRRGKDD